MKTLNHNDKFVINGIRCNLCTLAGFAAPLTIEEFYTKYPKQRANDPRPAGCSEGMALYGDKGAYVREAVKWADVPNIDDGEQVMIEGIEYIAKFNGQYTDAVIFNISKP